jgi:uncharacterized protein
MTMQSLRVLVVGLLLLSGFAPDRATAAPSTTPSAREQTTATGIPLDKPWKGVIYRLATAKFIHPAWGWQHSERNYQIALRLAHGDHLKVDTDVLFAAAFLHDMAAFPPYMASGVEHGDRAAVTSVDVLRKAGFPMDKIAAVQTAERGHMYYRDPGKEPEAVVLHDADSLDFLGTIGAARMISLTGEKASSFAPQIATLRSFLRDIPPRLVTTTAQKIGAQRAAELRRLLDELTAETFSGRAI